jgi:chemotaxis protein MotB
MKLNGKIILTISIATLLGSCVSQKKMALLKLQYNNLEQENKQKSDAINEITSKYQLCEQDKAIMAQNLLGKDNQSAELRSQIEDLRKTREIQNQTVGNLTVLTQKANENINKTLEQLEKKERYIDLLRSAKSKTDSLNLALSVNLKGALPMGLADDDVNIKVDKTVVMINLSDKMLYESGSYKLSPNAYTVLEKIAAIINSRPDIEVLIEGYTDNVPYKSGVLEDNWDLSAKRSTAVARILANTFAVNPNKLIAAGRGEHNALVTNTTVEGRAINRRTRIILMPKLDQFYDLLDPNKANK